MLQDCATTFVAVTTKASPDKAKLLFY